MVCESYTAPAYQECLSLEGNTWTLWNKIVLRSSNELYVSWSLVVFDNIVFSSLNISENLQ